jgi:hypothetical protein
MNFLNTLIKGQMDKIIIPWKEPKDGMPEKSGKLVNEQIPCIVILDRVIRILQWNCEHGWDDEDGDDYMCDAKEVDYYFPLSEIQTPQP